MEQQRKSQKWLWIAAVLACAGAQGPRGDTGEPGPAGQTGLVSVGTESPGANCSGGGAVIKSGLDANGNGTLDASEVTNTAYACTGSPDTAANLLAKLLTVDGAGSGLDADLLQGQSLDTVSPAGTVVAFAGPSGRVPAGWLLCDGRPFSRTTYAKLFAAIGVYHGNGDGTTTFNIPDYRGRFLRGVSYSSALDPDRASRTVLSTGVTGVVPNEVGSVQGYAAARPTNAFTTDTQGSHTHASGSYSQLLQTSTGGNNTPTAGDTSPGELDIFSHTTMANAGAHTHTVTGGGDNETRPVNGYVNYIIKY